MPPGPSWPRSTTDSAQKSFSRSTAQPEPSGPICQPASRCRCGAAERNGLKLGDLTADTAGCGACPRRGVLSRTGFQKVMNIVNADEQLETTKRTASRRGQPNPVWTRGVLRGDSRNAIAPLIAGCCSSAAITGDQRDHRGPAKRADAHPHGRAAGHLYIERTDSSTAGRRERQGVQTDKRAGRRAAETGHARLRGPQPRARFRRGRQGDPARRASAHRRSTGISARCCSISCGSGWTF